MTAIRYQITPAEKRLENIDKLEIDLESRLDRGEVDIVEYQKLKYALVIKRKRAWKSLCRAMEWPLDYCPERDDPALVVSIKPLEPDPPGVPVGADPPVPIKRRLLHYAIFWIDLYLLTEVLLLAKKLFGS